MIDPYAPTGQWEGLREERVLAALADEHGDENCPETGLTDEEWAEFLAMSEAVYGTGASTPVAEDAV